MTKNPYLTTLEEASSLCQSAMEKLYWANHEVQELQKKLDPELVPLYENNEQPFAQDCKKAVAQLDDAEKAINEAMAKKEELKALLNR